MAFKLILLVALTTVAFCECRSIKSMESTEMVDNLGHNDLVIRGHELDRKPVFHLADHPRKEDESYSDYILRLNRIKDEQNIMTAIVKILRTWQEGLPKIEMPQHEIGVRVIGKKDDEKARRTDDMNTSEWMIKQRDVMGRTGDDMMGRTNDVMGRSDDLMRRNDVAMRRITDDAMRRSNNIMRRTDDVSDDSESRD